MPRHKEVMASVWYSQNHCNFLKCDLRISCFVFHLLFCRVVIGQYKWTVDYNRSPVLEQLNQPIILNLLKGKFLVNWPPYRVSTDVSSVGPSSERMTSSWQWNLDSDFAMFLLWTQNYIQVLCRREDIVPSERVNTPSENLKTKWITSFRQPFITSHRSDILNSFITSAITTSKTLLCKIVCKRGLFFNHS